MTCRLNSHGQPHTLGHIGQAKVPLTLCFGLGFLGFGERRFFSAGFDEDFSFVSFLLFFFCFFFVI